MIVQPRLSSIGGYYPWRHGFACLTVASTLLLIFVGGLVTSTGSSLSVPDWPLSYGQFFPPMVGGIFYEHGHRMIAGTVALLTAGLALWTWREEPRGTVRRLAVVALAAVLLQAVLGGVTVLLRLPTVVSVSHAALAQAFFCLVIAVALTTSRAWLTAPPVKTDDRLRRLAIATTAAVYAQLLLGAVMRHTGAGLAIADFPLAEGRLIPDLDSFPVAIHFAHRVGAVVVTLLAVATSTRIFQAHGSEPRYTRPTTLLLSLVTVQILLGASIIWTHKAVVPTTTHVAVGAAILGTSLVIALRSARDASKAETWQAVPAAERASA